MVSYRCLLRDTHASKGHRSNAPVSERGVRHGVTHGTSTTALSWFRLTPTEKIAFFFFFFFLAPPFPPREQEFSNFFRMLLERCFQRSPPPLRTLVQDTFCGEVAYITRCLTCKGGPRQERTFNDLVLQINVRVGGLAGETEGGLAESRVPLLFLLLSLVVVVLVTLSLSL